MITYEELFSREAIAWAVRDGRLKHSRRDLRGSDGMSRGFFLDLHVEHRVEMLTRLVQEKAGWAPLTRVNIPKGPGKEGTRPICYPTTLDAVRMMIVGGWLNAYAETVLSPQAVAYRHALAMNRTIRGAFSAVRERDLHVQCVADVRSFFDTISWRHLDRVIDGLPADDAIKALVRAAVRGEIIDRKSGERVVRSAGTPQGLAISPVLANLVLHPVDLVLQRYVGPRAGVFARYADDCYSALNTIRQGQEAVDILTDQLGKLGLVIKPGTGEVVDLRQDGSVVRWLGVELRMPDSRLVLSVPPTTIEAKALALRAEMASGLASYEGVEDRLQQLHRYYELLVTRQEAEGAVSTIRDRVMRHGGADTDRMNIQREGRA